VSRSRIETFGALGLALVLAFRAGAEASSRKVVVREVFIGNFSDTASAREAALALLEEGADFLIHQANDAGRGVFQAVADRAAAGETVYAFGTNRDQREMAPEVVIASAVIDLPGAKNREDALELVGRTAELRFRPVLGFIPLFSGPAYGLSMMAGGFILAIMIIPIVTAISRDVILTVPQSQREAMLALGATRWEMVWGAVLPYARPGIVGAVLLGLGRALGETMAVTMVMGNVWNISSSVFAPAHSIASAIASEFTEAVDDVYIATLIELALVLFTITLLVNILARLLLWRIAGSLGRVRE